MASVRDLLGLAGPLADRVADFQPREEQQALAEAVEQALADGENLIAEAGTGTGKTFAYLLPALRARGRVIISTGTRTLQDQLFHKDLPVVRDALDMPVRVALLKGRGNYLCRYRMEHAEFDPRFDRREAARDLQQIRQWAAMTRSGDVSELAAVPADRPIWGRATSTVDNCLGQDCPDYGDCFLMEARKRAQEADVVVVNHHLLMADMALKEGGHGEVLPAADAYILDEAHQLPEVAAQFFGVSVSARQFMDLLRDVTAEDLREAGDEPELAGIVADLRKAVLDFRLCLGERPTRAAWASVENRPQVVQGVQELVDGLAAMHVLLERMAERGKGLEACNRRCAALSAELQAFLAPVETEAVPWFETHSQSFILRLTPLDVGRPLQAQMQRHPGAWVFTSATLSVAGGFEHFRRRLGLAEETRHVRLESPFDYANNAVLYVPRGLPEPNAPDYNRAFLEQAWPLVKASGGRAFLLFTSYRALHAAADWLRERCDYPLLVQGQASQRQLLDRFRDLGNAVLLGTASFWEGVDVKGEALSLVCIDRLPFASPADPVNEARIAHLRRNDGNPFRDFQLPQAVIALRQGVGRLIRDHTDRGVLMIGDPRLLGRSYGRRFLDSLPPMARTRDAAIVASFLQRPASRPSSE
ncbi:ATP-dependent DNA helicase [Methylonatrum kenyense]|uniref:ATP-dependent DNA helicase n=1 Tax=Methylonatrum kenyense TaxID=455253 RepID=UPI0020BF9E10|nr:ATP-dependent DNA helicase [Methylonatrum kenyense]MCK8514893.1 ATP-dependent DNA helicase [Methylonatrum kenyense]